MFILSVLTGVSGVALLGAQVTTPVYLSRNKEVHQYIDLGGSEINGKLINALQKITIQNHLIQEFMAKIMSLYANDRYQYPGGGTRIKKSEKGCL